MTDEELFDQSAHKISARFVDRIDADEHELKTYTGMLYHYTTPAGLLGILKSQKIWGTEAGYLNDSQEIDYGLEVVSSCLSSLCSDKRTWVKEFSQLVTDRITAQRGQHVYVACFCENGDLLSQ